MVRLFRQTVIFQAVGYLLQFGAFLVFAGILGSADQGALMVFRAVGQMVAAAMWLGLPAGIVYFMGKDRASLVSLCRNCLALFFVVFPLLALLLYLAPFDRVPKFSFLGRYAGPLIVFIFLLSFFNLFQQLVLSAKRYLAFNLFAFGAGALLFVSSLFVAAFPTQESKLTYAVICYIVAYGVMFLYGGVAVLSELSGWSGKVTATVSFPDQFRVGFKGFVSSIAGLLSFRIDLFLVGYFLSFKEVGIYSIALFSAEAITKVPCWLSLVLSPMVASDEEGHTRKTAYLFYSSMIIALLFGAVYAIAVSIFPDLLSRIVGREFAGVEICLLLLLPRVIMQSGAAALGANLAGKGYPWHHPAGTIASLVCLVLMDVVLIPRAGLVGAASANSIAFALCFAFFYLGYRKHNGTTILVHLRGFCSDALRLAGAMGSGRRATNV